MWRAIRKDLTDDYRHTGCLLCPFCARSGSGRWVSEGRLEAPAGSQSYETWRCPECGGVWRETFDRGPLRWTRGGWPSQRADVLKIEEEV